MPPNYRIIKQDYTVFKNIDWDALAKLDPLNDWQPVDLKTTFTRLRSMVRLHTRMSVSEIATKILNDLEELPGDMRSKRTDGKGIQARADKEKAMGANGEDLTDGQTRGKRRRKKGSKIRSEEFVDEADLEDEEEEAAAESSSKKKRRENKERRDKKKRNKRKRRYVDDPGPVGEDVVEGLHEQAMAGGFLMNIPIPKVMSRQQANLSTALGETAKAVMQYFDHGRLIDEDYDAVDDTPVA